MSLYSSAKPLSDFYRLKEHLPILALAFAPFAAAGFPDWRLFALDLAATFLALSSIYSVNNFFDSISGERNPAGSVRRLSGKAPAFFLSILPGIASVFLGSLLPGKCFFLLLAILLIFLAYSADFPRARNIPGPDFLLNVLGFYLVFAKSYFLYFKETGAFFIAFSVFIVSFYSVSEAVHQLAHEREDSRLGRKTLFGILGRGGAIALSAALLALPIIFWRGLPSAASLAFSALRLFSVASTSGDFRALRKELYGREELAVQLALFAFLVPA
ncbi:MAG: UbiA family prenyltransferase [archaeon]